MDRGKDGDLGAGTAHEPRARSTTTLVFGVPVVTLGNDISFRVCDRKSLAGPLTH